MRFNRCYGCMSELKNEEEPCPVCGEPIVKEAYLGGAVYYCPGCQPLK